MPQMTLDRDQVAKMVAFADDRKLSSFFIAKDQGAYVGVSAGSQEQDQCVYYFKGMNPEKDQAWWHTCTRAFGGDDFGVTFKLDGLRKMLANPKSVKLKIIVGATSVRIDILSNK